MAYLNRLEVEGVLPQENHAINHPQIERRRQAPRRGRPPLGRPQQTFIPADASAIAWRADQGRVRAIWEELQALPLASYPNGISALARILLEMAADSYLNNRRLQNPDNLSHKIRSASLDLLNRDVIDREYQAELDRMRQHSEIISIRSMQRYVHSQTFAPLPNELIVYWQRLGPFISACLNH